jgi:glutathione S-transferase
LLDAQASQGNDWLGGRAPSILDIYLATCLRWCALYPAGETDWFALWRYPALAELAARLEARDTVQSAAAAEGLGPRPFTDPRPPNPSTGSAR